jgi:hypothetical protein
MRMNTRSAREYTMFASVRGLRSWREQRPSNECDVDSSVTREVGKVYYTELYVLLVLVLCRST